MGVPITYNLRNLVERKATTLMTAVGIGLTVAVLVTAMALTAGLEKVFASTKPVRPASSLISARTILPEWCRSNRAGSLRMRIPTKLMKGSSI